ncbi:MAG: Undecaprenyl-phosphate glycophosphotransferase [uncultured Rubrobacteraceae bacterium]|uniref:Undecaprenyl-phosphate glycophosphotransferase n=1 Tax=uncultured Rubrobacteraceae bacterium TaxID=349277 RepID=A0A6J4QNY3_9ACTN|nr:MAG: Undecaprenyl-phosphate glycophosphotransferase [uncultured Rubrobacteraceae bacterium]
MREAARRLFRFHAFRRLLSVVVLIFVDAAALSAGVLVTSYLTGAGQEILAYLPVVLAVGLALFAAQDLYDRAVARRNPAALLGAVMWWAGLLAIGSVVYPGSGFRLGGVLLAALLALVVSGALRFLYEQGVEWIYRRGSFRIPTLVIGEKEDRERLIRALDASPSAYRLVGELSLSDGRVDLPRLRETLDETEVRNVILAGAERLDDEEFLDLLRSVRLRRVKLRVVPGAITLLRTRPVLSEYTGVPLFEIGYPSLDNTQRSLKRLLDVTGSLLGLTLLSPLLLSVALAVKLTSPGPVLFRQKRIGADEKVFICYMFRSMYEDAEARQEELERMNEADGAVFKIKNDPRITPVGRFIRRWSIDELPQLINVLKGEMSLVGPRPLPLRDFERMSEMHKRRLAAIPGMSGYWQISGRSNLSFEDMVRLDLYYIENWSLSFDIKIILKTLGAVLKREGAY